MLHSDLYENLRDGALGTLVFPLREQLADPFLCDWVQVRQIDTLTPTGLNSSWTVQNLSVALLVA